MDKIEISAKTVEEAITKACLELGVPSDSLDIEVVSEGSKGFLGIGGKDAEILVSKKEEETPVGTKENITKKKEGKEKKASEKAPFKKRQSEEIPEKTQEEIEEMTAKAEGFLREIFDNVDIPAEFKTDYDKETGFLNIEFSGDEKGIMIGKRGQTLDSLQYLTSLVVNKGRGGYVRVKLDTEDYRKRRKATLENLANNIAAKVKRTGKPVSLEAMNPYERRIIHSALQSNSYVETYSEGREPYRHIIVAPKK